MEGRIRKQKIVDSSGNQGFMYETCDHLRKRTGFEKAKHKGLAGLEKCCGEMRAMVKVHQGQRVTILTAELEET